MRTNFLCCVLVACLCCSCATWREREGVNVSFVNVLPVEATVWETTLQFTVRVQNELNEPVVLDGAVHKIYLNGLYIGEGLTNERLEVPRLSSATQPVTVHLRNIAVATRLRGIVESQQVNYKISSVLYTSLGKSRVSREGSLAVRDFQPAPR